MLYLRDAFPRERWTGALPETAAFWLQMHAGFRAQQALMADTAARWRSGDLDPRGLHAALLPTLQAFLQHLDGHHRVESGHYFPHFRRIEPRIQSGLDLLDRDHDAIHAHLDALYHSAVAFHQATTANSPDTPDHAHRLTDVLDLAAPGLIRHLDDEEDIVIPLLALKGEPAA
ncbi:MAG: hemerythrin domain-containing protein [Brevundimonas sp.]